MLRNLSPKWVLGQGEVGDIQFFICTPPPPNDGESLPRKVRIFSSKVPTKNKFSKDDNNKLRDWIPVIFTARANGFNICFNISSILLNAVERLLNDVERRDGKRFQHLIQQNFASGLVVSSRL